MVIALGKRDAVAQSVLRVVLDLMLPVGVCHAEQVLFQQFRTAQHRAVVQERGDKPEGSWRRVREEVKTPRLCLTFDPSTRLIELP